MVRQLRLARAVDAGDHMAASEAAHALVAGAGTLPAAFRGQVALSMAAWAACCSADTALLEAWRAHCSGAILDATPLLHWLDGELARRHGDHAAARRELAAARRTLGRLPDAGGAKALSDALDRLEQALQGAPPGGATACRAAGTAAAATTSAM